mgnify:CR=1 FL=1
MCKKWVIMALLLPALLLGCTGQDGSTPRLFLDGSLSSLQFESSAERDRILKIESIIEKRTGLGWREVGYEEAGNFYEKRWCTGSGAPEDCLPSASTANDKDQEIIELYTLHFGDEPEFFGIGFGVTKVPRQGWAVAFSFSENGKSVVGDGFNINFDFITQDQEPARSVSFADGIDYRVYEKQVFHNAAMPWRDEMKIYFSSAESMRDHGTAQLEALEKKVTEYVDSKAALRCVYEPYQGGGIPPRCIEERPLTADEKKEVLENAQQYFSEQKETLAKDYKEMYAALLDAVPAGVVG